MICFANVVNFANNQKLLWLNFYRRMFILVTDGTRIVHLRLFFFFPNRADITIDPTLRSSPPRVVGMPVARAIFCLAALMPTALFSENDNPGIFMILTFGDRCMVKAPRTCRARSISVALWW